MSSTPALSKRQRQIMDVLFQHGEATAAEVHESLPDPPSYTAVRTMLRTLEERGLIEHRQEGRRYIYWPCASTRSEGRSAIQRVLQVFFGGSLEEALAAHLSDPQVRPDAEELERLRSLVEQAEQRPKRKGRAQSKKGTR